MTTQQALAAKVRGRTSATTGSLFAEARESGPVHRVTLTDGHLAWLAVRYDEARSLLDDRQRCKDMQAAMAAIPDVVAEGLRGSGFPAHDHKKLAAAIDAVGSTVAAFDNKPDPATQTDMHEAVAALRDQFFPHRRGAEGAACDRISFCCQLRCAR